MITNTCMPHWENKSSVHENTQEKREKKYNYDNEKDEREEAKGRKAAEKKNQKRVDKECLWINTSELICMYAQNEVPNYPFYPRTMSTPSYIPNFHALSN